MAGYSSGGPVLRLEIAECGGRTHQESSLLPQPTRSGDLAKRSPRQGGGGANHPGFLGWFLWRWIYDPHLPSRAPKWHHQHVLAGVPRRRAI